MSAPNRRLLIIDDEPEIRRGYRAFLNPERVPRLESSRHVTAPDSDPATEYAFELSEAESGERALEIVKSELAAFRHFAGAIVDVRMPGRIDGLQFIQKAWELDPNLLVVVVTAYQDRSVDDIARMFGPRFQDQWDFLAKPFTSGEIVQKARNLVSGWNRRERERAHLKMIKDQQAALVAQEQIAIVGRLARNVGHDLGNILQHVLSKLEASRSLPAEEKEDVLEGVELGAAICRDLMTFGRAEGDRGPVARVLLSAPIQKALRLLRHELKRKELAVALEIDETVECRGQETRLLQVFANLLTNAIQAMSGPGELRIRAWKDAEGSAFAEIIDSGCGIAAENLEKVFEPLFTTKGEDGNGLGLAVCKKIVESYRGTLVIESRVGRGTTVRMRFPSRAP
jgi:signal transduction histidine kinase